MEKEVAGLEQSLGQIHAATFSAGSLSSMLASALQYQAESEAQLARVETHLEQYGYTPVERAQPEQEAEQGQPEAAPQQEAQQEAEPQPEAEQEQEEDDQAQEPQSAAEVEQQQVEADWTESPGAERAGSVEPDAADDSPCPLAAADAMEPEESPAPSVASAPSFRWSSPTPAVAPPAAVTPPTATLPAADAVDVDPMRTPTLADFGISASSLAQKCKLQRLPCWPWF